MTDRRNHNRQLLYRLEKERIGSRSRTEFTFSLIRLDIATCFEYPKNRLFRGTRSLLRGFVF